LLAELDLCKAVADHLPPRAIVRNLVGYGASESLLGVADIDAYFCHVGTLQHKLGFFSDARGVVHGPTHQLANPETGPYHTETGHAPLFLSADAVSDVPLDTNRGAGFYDYKITDYRQVIQLLHSCLKERGW
jgi:hypothetical protein